MGRYDFTLKFEFSDHDTDPEQYVEKLLAGGCDDALIGLGQQGRIALDFSREARSADEAVISALSDIQRIIPGVKLIEAMPDLVGLTDIANLLGFSRQNMRKLVVKKGSGFPPPIHDGKPAIWHLATVLSWFTERKNRQFDDAIVDISRVNMQCNILRESTKLDRSVSSRLEDLIA